MTCQMLLCDDILTVPTGLFSSEWPWSMDSVRCVWCTPACCSIIFIPVQARSWLLLSVLHHRKYQVVSTSSIAFSQTWWCRRCWTRVFTMLRGHALPYEVLTIVHLFLTEQNFMPAGPWLFFFFLHFLIFSFCHIQTFPYYLLMVIRQPFDS
jgi:hypothetical protein